MRIRLLASIAVWLLFGASAARATDPTIAVADAYRLQFENTHLRVERVHYPAGTSVPEHTHPAGAMLYIYLNDAEGIIFRHLGAMTHVTRRPAVKAGAMRIAIGREEHHTAENTSAAAADALRIHVKTAAGARRGGRVAARPFGGDSTTFAEFTSEPFEIQRVFVAPKQSLTVDTSGDPAPSLWISLPSGETRWSEARSQEVVTNEGTTPMELVRVIIRARS